MWISLERFSECNPQQAFLIHIPGWFEIQSRILALLSPSESQRYLRSCVYLILDTKDLLLTATAIRIRYQGSGFSVATPPVQPALPLAGQGGGVWDQDLSSSSNITEGSNITEVSGNHALEVQNSD